MEPFDAVQKTIVIQGAKEHNLKNVNIEIPRWKFVVITGISGSGKSSLAFDTLYAEGQRRYVESLSSYARQFLGQMEKPQVDFIGGLSPAIAIEQKNSGHNPRSTVGTITEIYDYLRVLFARAGTQYCPECGDPITSQTIQQMVESILALPSGTKLMITSPVVRNRKGEHRDIIESARKDGFVRIRIDGELFDLDDTISLDKKKKHDIDIIVDRLVMKEGIRSRLADSVEIALKMSDGLLKTIIPGGEEKLFSVNASCMNCGLSFPPLTPQRFSFNSPSGMCPKCSGLGTIMLMDPEAVVRFPELSLEDGAVPYLSLNYGGEMTRQRRRFVQICKYLDISLTAPWSQLPKDAQDFILLGSRDILKRFKGRIPRSVSSWKGIIPEVQRLYVQTQSNTRRSWYSQFLRTVECPECKGGRLDKAARAVKFNGLGIHEVSALSIKEILRWMDGLQLSEYQQKIVGELLREIKSRLVFLRDVGLHYLTLDRPAPSLSGGESQRIRLASQIGSGLVGVLYILDEPSIGLHAKDTTRLIDTLKRLKNMGNTVIVVEHDPVTIQAADYIVDMGPGAGHRGGQVVAVGPPQSIADNPNSLTGAYLSGRKSIPVPLKRRKKNQGTLVIWGASEHNLKNINVRIPLSKFVCITGVSGSGKSTLVNDILYRGLMNILNYSKKHPGQHDKITGYEPIHRVIEVTQRPIGRTPRSNPVTYTGAFTHIRNLFARLPESRLRGYTPGRFSFNVPGGRCEACSGDGMKRISMHFLPDVFVTCEVCKGSRFNRETLDVRYRGLNIADILNLEVREALELFRNVPAIVKILKTLDDVGMDYIKLGQPAPSLSGGEAQRIKLAKELAKNTSGNTLYILDEPTTGLHSEDIGKLLNILHRLVDAGNTIVVIEHNMDVIKNADYIIDLGPEGGDDGGQVVAHGTPEDVVRNFDSHTAKFLKDYLNV